MLGILSLSVCIACISCLCCLCTVTVVAVPGLIDLHNDMLLCEKRQCDEKKRRSEEIFSSEVKKIISTRNEGITSEETESEACPCVMTYVLDPILQSRNSGKDCTNRTNRRKTCKCPAFLDLVGEPPKSPAKILPRS